MKSEIVSLVFFATALFFQITVGLSPAMATPGDSDSLSPGLVGILFNDPAMTRPRTQWLIKEINSDKIDWQNMNDWVAQWFGWIEAPVSGEVAFLADADNGLKLKIGGKTVIDGWGRKKARSGKMEMVKGEKYPILLSYFQDGGDSYLRLYWQWQGQKKMLIPGNVLWHTEANKEQIKERMRELAPLSDADLTFDVAKIIGIFTEKDVAAKREQLIELIFGGKELLKRLPDEIETGIIDPDFADLQNLLRIDKLIIHLPFGLKSIVYHFVAQQGNCELMIYHQGHRGHFLQGKRVINALLQKGFDVIALAMPLKGMNEKLVVFHPHFGKLKITEHERLALLKPEKGHPLCYFLEPVIVAINYAQKFGYRRINMMGISGGGWTTTMCAALDKRIAHNFPVAGSLPFYLRCQDLKSGTWGDYEQWVAEVYQIANYLELYILGATGEGRRQLQILNEFDSCCFSGTGYRSYEKIVAERVKKLGAGKFSVWLDSTHYEHKISDAALEVIFRDLNR